MSVILILILASLTLAGAFLACFIWAVRSGQFDDTFTPSMRMLTDEEKSQISNLKSQISKTDRRARSASSEHQFNPRKKDVTLS
jgi:cbb3-type cytochrome oxidase maturation protein